MIFTDNKYIITLEDYNKFKHVADDDIFEEYESKDAYNEIETDIKNDIQHTEDYQLNSSKLDLT